MKVIYSLRPDLRLDVRSCEDGVLVYDHLARTTHLLPPVAWDFFASLSQENAAALQGEFSELEVDTLPDDDSRLAMVSALERAGLIMRC